MLMMPAASGYLLIDCNFPLAIVGRGDSATFTSCSSGHAGVRPRSAPQRVLVVRTVAGHTVPAMPVGCTPQLAQVLGSSSELSELLQLLVLTEMTLHCRSKGHIDTETCSRPMNISAEQAFIPGVSHFNGYFMTLNLAVQRVSVKRQGTLIGAFHSTLHGSEGGSPSCVVDSDVVCRLTVWESNLRELLSLLPPNCWSVSEASGTGIPT